VGVGFAGAVLRGGSGSVVVQVWVVGRRMGGAAAVLTGMVVYDVRSRGVEGLVAAPHPVSRPVLSAVLMSITATAAC
jgi:hypothetical protein